MERKPGVDGRSRFRGDALYAEPVGSPAMAPEEVINELKGMDKWLTVSTGMNACNKRAPPDRLRRHEGFDHATSSCKK